MWPFRNRSRPHPRFVRSCPGTGRMPGRIMGRRILTDTSEVLEIEELEPLDNGHWAAWSPNTTLCPVCKQERIPVRKHRDTTHNWPAGSLRLHSRPRDEAKRGWWRVI